MDGRTDVQRRTQGDVLLLLNIQTSDDATPCLCSCSSPTSVVTSASMWHTTSGVPSTPARHNAVQRRVGAEAAPAAPAPTPAAPAAAADRHTKPSISRRHVLRMHESIESYCLRWQTCNNDDDKFKLMPVRDCSLSVVSLGVYFCLYLVYRSSSFLFLITFNVQKYLIFWTV